MPAEQRRRNAQEHHKENSYEINLELLEEIQVSLR
jgi:hypothetical protein